MNAAMPTIDRHSCGTQPAAEARSGASCSARYCVVTRLTPSSESWPVADATASQRVRCDASHCYRIARVGER